MVKVRSVEALIVDVPTVRPHILAMATMHTQSVVLIHLVCEDGIDGWGEATTIGGLSYGDESPEGVCLAVQLYFAPLIVGRDAERPGSIMAMLNKAIVGNHFAKCGIETALLDALGKRVGLPVSELIGGCIRDRLPVLWTLASGDTDRDIDEARDMLARRRHNAFKLKIGKRPLIEDVAHVAAIKHALGDAASIRVDVNQSWEEAEAKRAMPMLAEAGIDLVEQPIARGNRAGMARLTASGTVAVMADEALHGPIDAFSFAQCGAADVFALKIAQSGGLHAARAVSAIADAAGVAIYGGTMLEAGIGTIASAHVFSTIRALPFGTELFGPLLLTEELLTEPLDYSDFTLAIPTAPGLGVSPNPVAISEFRRDRLAKSFSHNHVGA